MLPGIRCANPFVTLLQLIVLRWLQASYGEMETVQLREGRNGNECLVMEKNGG